VSSYLSLTDDTVAFPTLADSELAVLEALGTRRSVTVSEYLYREGDTTYDFYVIRSGAVEIVVRSDGEERIITRHGPGQFLGELNLLTGQRVYLSARVLEPGAVIVVSRAMLQHVIATNPGLSGTILAAFLARRSRLLSGPAAAIRVVGSRFSPETLRIGEFLARNRIPHEWLDPDRDAAIEHLQREFAVTPDELPVVIASGSLLRHPTPGGLAQYLGLTIDSLPERCFDLVVVGAGPPVWQRLSMVPLRDCEPWSLSWLLSVVRQQPARASRTTSGSRPGSPAATSRCVQLSKPRSSAPTSPARARPRRCVRRPGIS
jgi:thioredoxin reductase (NADPH)